MNDIKDKCINCTLCSLHKTCKNVVFGSGNTAAKVIFIGEAPGANEDESAMPFVGRGGQLLNEMLAQAGISRENDIYITNIVKCRPPENRDPKQIELQTCIQHLNAQIDFMKPLLIVCVGRITSQYFMGKNHKISSEHGKFKIIDGVYFTSVLHPAAILRNINLKPLSQNDYKLIKEKMIELGCI